MTQPQLAGLLDLSVRQVQNIEAGAVIPWKYFQRLGEIFPGRTLGWFLHGEPEPVQESGYPEVLERLQTLQATVDELVEALRKP